VKQSIDGILGLLVLRSSPAGSDNYELKPKYKKGSNKKEKKNSLELQYLPTLNSFYTLFYFFD
jgi:hypothetical protein